jgi:hypothetical protein
MKTWLGASGRSEKFGQMQQMDLIHGQVNPKPLAGASARSENVGQDENHSPVDVIPWSVASDKEETMAKFIRRI